MIRDVLQLTIQGIGVVVVALTLYVYYRQLRTMNDQRRAMEREMAARMRPWIGLFGFGFEPALPPPHKRNNLLKILLKNCGALPAQRARLSLVLQPSATAGEQDNPIEWEEPGIKALVPGEEGNYGIDLSKYPDFSKWLEDHRDVIIKGRMNYMLDQTSYKTEFEATLRFSEQLDQNGDVKTRWRNTELT